MNKITPYLFVYGTLLSEGNEFAIYLNRNSSFYGKGRLKGKLFAIGEYPGAIYLPDGDDYVYGIIMLLADAQAVLQKLDVYEGFGEAEPQPNLFIRGLLTVEHADTYLNCWVYLYNLPIDGFKQIESGDYLVR